MGLKIKVHTKGITGSSITKAGEEPGVLFGAVLEVDGHLIEEAFKVEVTFEEGICVVTPRLYPGSFEVVSHTDESWPELLARIQSERAERAARTGMGRFIGEDVTNQPEMVPG